MNSRSPALTVQHRPDLGRFEAAVGDRLAIVEYSAEADRISIDHTFVPTELRGQGIAEALTLAALAWVETDGRPLVPACSYTAGFLRRHPEAFPAARIWASDHPPFCRLS